MLVDNNKIPSVNNTILTTKLAFYCTNMDDTKPILQFIRASRKAIDGVHLDAFPSGFIYALYEQYLDVNHYLIMCLIYVGIGVFGSLFALIWHPGAVLIAFGVIVKTIVEVYGFLFWLGLKVNGVCVVNMVMGVGVSVEFVAHVVRTFMITEGTRLERGQETFRVMFAPMLSGGFSTFLSVFFMAFAKFPYFRLYFFNMYVLITLFGVFNGILVLPILLSIMGPAAVTMDGQKGTKLTKVHPYMVKQVDEDTEMATTAPA